MARLLCFQVWENSKLEKRAGGPLFCCSGRFQRGRRRRKREIFDVIEKMTVAACST